MKIVNTIANKAYQLNPDTQLEVERPNLFFNEWGEQTLPIDLPDTDLNRLLTGYPDILSNRNKVSSRIDCSIQDGEYFMPCRQAILGAKRNEKISTSFYMNEGSFLSRISEVALTDIFGDEVIPGVTTIQQGIDFCWSLIDNSHPQYALFPIYVDLDGERRFVNRITYMNENGKVTETDRRGHNGGTLGFYNSFERKETVDDRTITLAPGYYISPFIRASYLLKRIFSYFGYTLKDNFFTTTEPFKSMVFINNTIDSLVNGTIMLVHLVPDCMCNTILELFRKKYCCEFVSDEVERTVTIELFSENIKDRSEIDLTPYLVSHPEISYQSYRQLKLSSEKVIKEGTSYDATYEIEAKYPEAWFNRDDCGYYHSGYSSIEIIERISDGNLPYYAGGSLKAYEVKVPDCQFCLTGKSIPYIGEGRALNSTIEGLPVTEATEDAESSEEDISANNASQAPILSFVYYDGTTYSVGTNVDKGNWGYTLLYNGPCGIFEKFYRDFDNILRNSLHKVTAKFLFPSILKSSLPVHRKVTLQGTDVLVNVLKYTIGGKSEPIDSELFTTALYEPISIAKSEEERMPVNKTGYKWSVQKVTHDSTEQEYIAAGYKVSESSRNMNDIPAIYPYPPTKAMYDSGKTYFHRVFFQWYTSRLDKKKKYYRIEVSLKPVPYV